MQSWRQPRNNARYLWLLCSTLCITLAVSTAIVMYAMAAAVFQVLGAINADPATPGSAGRKTQYQKLTQLEHVLVRPDTYIGSVERITDTLVV